MPDLSRATQILVAARNRTEADAYPQLGELRLRAGLREHRRRGQGRTCEHLTQREVSLLLGYVDRRTEWYKHLELGKISQPSRDDLSRVSKLLKLSHDEDEQLQIAFFGSRTVKTSQPDAGLDVAPVWARIIHSSSVPTYISNRSWDVIAFNAAADQLFGGMPDNVLRELLGLRHGRHENSTQPYPKPPMSRRALEQIEMLGLPLQPEHRRHMPDWPKTWARAAATGLRNALADHPQDMILQQIRAEVLQDPELRAIYEGPVGEEVGDEDQHTHPDGTRRLMYNAAVGEIGVMEGGVAEPLRAIGARVVWMEWWPLGQATNTCQPKCGLYHIHRRR
ncbi:hypothetical protein [Streptomyces lydicus]|uniref:MmyB family transcriptional regulator n=1 Tax=Streptomyces lydicus TaxID=47763 RepID=UPI0010104CD8|nr:hypothetical protein [Streptomyces lydicus]MCZ1012085.1 hypothetical protein [Streptomyces lydicus]